MKLKFCKTVICPKSQPTVTEPGTKPHSLMLCPQEQSYGKHGGTAAARKLLLAIRRDETLLQGLSELLPRVKWGRMIKSSVKPKVLYKDEGSEHHSRQTVSSKTGIQWRPVWLWFTFYSSGCPHFFLPKNIQEMERQWALHFAEEHKKH